MNRIFDFYVSSVGLVILFPLIIIISIIIRLTMGKPIFFKQIRSKKDGEAFKIIKFRTMSDERDDEGELLPNDLRVSKFGDFLRKTSLDELPQLINVISGDLSVVGPRPLHLEYNKHYTEEQAKRLTVKPGITGWAQINGRNSLSWEDKFILDTWYVENKSFSLDLYIILKTFTKVFSQKDINSSTNEQVESFRGS